MFAMDNIETKKTKTIATKKTNVTLRVLLQYIAVVKKGREN